MFPVWYWYLLYTVLFRQVLEFIPLKFLVIIYLPLLIYYIPIWIEYKKYGIQ